MLHAFSIAVGASEFNDMPEGGGDRAAQQAPPKMPKHRCRIVGLLASFLPTPSFLSAQPHPLKSCREQSELHWAGSGSGLATASETLAYSLLFILAEFQDGITEFTNLLWDRVDYILRRLRGLTACRYNERFGTRGLSLRARLLRISRFQFVS